MSLSNYERDAVRCPNQALQIAKTNETYAKNNGSYQVAAANAQQRAADWRSYAAELAHKKQ